MESSEKRPSPAVALRVSAQSGEAGERSIAAPRMTSATGPWHRLRPFLLPLAAALFVAASGLAAASPVAESTTGSGVVSDAAGRVVTVDPHSEAYAEGVRIGWQMMASDGGVTMYTDGVDGAVGANVVRVGDAPLAAAPVPNLWPSIAFLVAAGLLALLRLLRTATTLAVAAAALGTPMLEARFGLPGTVSGLLPASMGAAFAWQVGRSTPLRPGRTSILVVFVAVPAAVLVAVWVVAGGIAAALVVTFVYLALAWAVVMRWRVSLAIADEPPSRLALLRLVVVEMLPFSDRLRRRGARAERDRLASELHAEVLPAIATTAAELDRRGAADAAEEVRKLAAGVRDVVSERRLPVLDDEGLVAAAEWLAESLEGKAPVSVEIDLRGDTGVRAPIEVERAAYRVLQLALDNVIAHAGAKLATVSIAESAHSLVVRVADDGRGIGTGSAAQALRQGRLGIADMRSESEGVGAAFSVGPGSPSGTVVEMRWPA